MSAGEFWKETQVMLAKEWKMCIYCIILMTWVSFKSLCLPPSANQQLI